MEGLVIMIVCCTALAAISQRRDNSTLHRRHAKKDRIFATILTCYMIIFAGLRTGYNDTYTYLNSFSASKTFPKILNGLDWTLGTNPGFKIFTSVIRTLTNNRNTYLMICSAFVLGTNMWFIHKHTKSFGFSVFIFFTLGYYLFAMAAVKQTLATAIGLIALEQLFKKKRLRFTLLLILGATFHPYCLMYFCAPILMKQVPWKKGTWILIVVVLIVSYSFNFLVRTILDVTDIMGEGYDKDTFVGEGVNIFRVLVYFVPVLISFFWKRALFERSSKYDNFFVNCSIICALIMFIGMFGNANMFARLAMYFEPPIYIALPWMLYKLRGKIEGIFLSVLASASFPVYFYYMTVLNKPFDELFVSMSLSDYFKTLIPG